MPLFHFHVVTAAQNEHVGSIELQHVRDVLTVGSEITTRLAVRFGAHAISDEGWAIQATDDTGKSVCTFYVGRRRAGRERPNDYLH